MDSVSGSVGSRGDAVAGPRGGARCGGPRGRRPGGRSAESASLDGRRGPPGDRPSSAVRPATGGRGCRPPSRHFRGHRSRGDRADLQCQRGLSSARRGGLRVDPRCRSGARRSSSGRRCRRDPVAGPDGGGVECPCRCVRSRVGRWVQLSGDGPGARDLRSSCAAGTRSRARSPADESDRVGTGASLPLAVDVTVDVSVQPDAQVAKLRLSPSHRNCRKNSVIRARAFSMSAIEQAYDSRTCASLPKGCPGTTATPASSRSASAIAIEPSRPGRTP